MRIVGLEGLMMFMFIVNQTYPLTTPQQQKIKANCYIYVMTLDVFIKRKKQKTNKRTISMR